MEVELALFYLLEGSDLVPEKHQLATLEARHHAEVRLDPRRHASDHRASGPFRRAGAVRHLPRTATGSVRCRQVRTTILFSRVPTAYVARRSIPCAVSLWDEEGGQTEDRRLFSERTLRWRAGRKNPRRAAPLLVLSSVKTPAYLWFDETRCRKTPTAVSDIGREHKAQVHPRGLWKCDARRGTSRGARAENARTRRHSVQHQWKMETVPKARQPPDRLHEEGTAVALSICGALAVSVKKLLFRDVGGGNILT